MCQAPHPTCDAFALMEPSGHVPTPRYTLRLVPWSHGQGHSGAEKQACGCRHREETQTGRGESMADHAVAQMEWTGDE